jgi:transposase
MNRRTRRSLQSVSRQKELNLINPNTAGIDIGSEEHYVAVPANRCQEPVKKFGCFTQDIKAMAQWLRECAITSIAMESTGVYWIPVFQILESEGFEVILVNAHDVKNLPGRKTDVLDCQWIQILHSYGLLRGSFRPDDATINLRTYVRQRDRLTRLASMHIQRMQKAMTEMNIQLHHAISDITGATGTRIIEAILKGERDPAKLALLKDYRTKNDLITIAASLQGDWREDQLFILDQEYAAWGYVHHQIEQIDNQISTYLGTMQKKTRIANVDSVKQLLQEVCGVDLCKVHGLDTNTILVLISEIGVNMTHWKDDKHFASWLGLCPNHRITGGIIHRRHSRKVVNRASRALRLAALSLKKSSCALGAFFRRIQAKAGTPKAITATAHKLAKLYYQLVSTQQEYKDIGANYYEQRYRSNLINSLKRKAQQLGCQLIENQEISAPPKIAVS